MAARSRVAKSETAEEQRKYILACVAIFFHIFHVRVDENAR